MSHHPTMISSSSSSPRRMIIAPKATSGFRHLLEQATAPLDAATTTTSIQQQQPYRIDYWRFKKRLKFIARRRCRILQQQRRSMDDPTLAGYWNGATAEPGGANDDVAHVPLSYHCTTATTPHDDGDVRNGIRTTSTSVSSTVMMELTNGDYVAMHDNPPRDATWYTTTTTTTTNIEDDSSQTTVSSAARLPHRNHHHNNAISCYGMVDACTILTPPWSPSAAPENAATTTTSAVAAPPTPRRTMMRKLSVSERNEIVAFLEWEMDQCHLYYASQYARLYERYQTFLVQLHSDQNTSVVDVHPDSAMAATELLLSNMIELGDDMMELVAYCTINTMIAQQILIRYDALALTLEGTPLMNYYLKRVLQQQPPHDPSRHNNNMTSSYYKIRYHDEVYNLANEFITNVIIASSSTSCDNDDDDSTFAYTTRAYVTHMQEQLDLFHRILDSLWQPTAVASSSSSYHRDSSGTSSHTVPSTASTTTTSPSYWYNTLKYALSSYFESMMRYSVKAYLQMGLFEDSGLGLEPGFLTNRGQSLTKEMQSMVEWRQAKQHWYTTFHNNNNRNKNNINDDNTMPTKVSTDQPATYYYYYNYYNPLYHRQGAASSAATSRSAPTISEKKLSGLQIFHLTLNMLAAFLYCMNYYIVEPSSTMYVNRLGAHDAMSGTLIGMMPLAAFVSSIPYSMWTNRSFRHPFIMSSIMLIAGNLTYSFADQFGVVWIALLGRFMAGLGAPKCIIRRYMADTTPVSLRTSVNAGFGMVVAAGSAMGPAMAIILNRFEYTCYVKHLGLVTLNGLTLPGYFMACLWFTFFMIVVLTFEEPDREGLKEQKELEARGAIPFSPSNMGSFGIPDDSDDIIRTTEASHDNIVMNNNSNNHVRRDDELYSVFSGESHGDAEPTMMNHNNNDTIHHHATWIESHLPRWMIRIVHYSDLITLPVRICLCLLFCKVFTIEALVSSTSALTKNRYQWQVTQVGKLGFANGVMVIPFSILVGRLSMTYQDHVLMKWLVGLGCCGMFLLIDLSDLVGTPRYRYNAGHILAVAPRRYICGYFLSYLSIQAFEGVIGSTLSKVIPTALASGTFNSGLLATLVDTFGRTCGDLFISAAGFLSLRQLMNLLFIPGFAIMLSCLIIIERCRDLLSV